MTVDLEDRLRSDLPRLADQLLVAPEADVPLLPVASLVPARRRWLVAAAGVAALALVAAVAVAARPDPEHQRTSTTDVPTTTTRPAGTWRALPTPPLPPREDAPSVWTGREWLLFGGRDGIMAFNDGAAYEPVTDRWRKLTPPIDMHPGAEAVWTGKVVAVLAKNGGWIYDPAADAWSDLPIQDDTGPVIAGAAEWTGHEVVAVGFTGVVPVLAARTLDPEHRRWGPTSSAPSAARLVATGIVGTRWDGSRVQVWLADGSGWAFDPATRDWSPLPTLEVPGRSSETMSAVTGAGATTYALVSTANGGVSSHQLARFEDGRWTLLGEPQQTVTADVECQLTSAGDALVRFCARSGPARIDPSTGEVQPYDDPAVGAGTGRSVAWTGDELLVFGGRNTAALSATGELTAKAAALTP